MNDLFNKQPTQPGVPADEHAPSPAIPKYIGPYKIESLLEKGGMSLLYLGTHPETKEPVTIKILLPKYVSHAEVVQRFLNEAEIIAMADHPNIVKLYGHGEWAGGLYIAMEFIQGISLRQYLLQTPMSLKRALEIILDIAYALCHLHTHGVIHRDLKPENILVTETGSIKVIDFGISQLLTSKPAQDENMKPRLIGTPIYMSPEQRENPETVSYPSDIYSLGIISYELVLGKLSHGQIHIALMPKGFQKILSKALQYKPDDRYQDIVDFITDTTAYLNSANLQKEKKIGDRLSELSESLTQAQSLLIPSEPPRWPGMDIGMSIIKNVNVMSAYCEFFETLEGNYGIILCESSAMGAEGVVFMAIFRGMIKALQQMTSQPVALISQLNDLLIKDQLNQVYTLSYLILIPTKNEIQFISCGYGNLWILPAGTEKPFKVTSENVALGMDQEAEFVDVSHAWNEGDILLLSSFASLYGKGNEEVDYSERLFRQMIIENAVHSPQKMVDGIARRIKLTSSKQILEKPITLIAIQRTSP